MTHVTNEELKITPIAQSYALASDEDRCAVRHKVAVPAKLRFSGCSNFAVTVTDLSLAGFACDAMVQAHPGTRCWLALPGLTPLEAEVVHRNNLGLGCAFHNLLNAAVLDRFVAGYPAS
ncbi:PilZ domain-containing protein [Parasphingorhabdus sp.]|uniref:PilZ domain-containing protein n=1 Tax=Parasphingorhabdus sp. TaxID=2709688 RepID=UPI002F944C14